MASSDVPPETTVISAEDLRQLAHPIRWKLWESLVYDGPGTATTLAGRVGESSGSTSYHLRQLERMGLIEEMLDHGNLRDRWWRAIKGAYRVSDASRGTKSAGVYETVQAMTAQSATERYLEFAAWAARATGADEEWAAAAFSDQIVLSLTAADLDKLSQELESLLARWIEREPANTDQARPVEILVRGFPRRAQH